MSTAQSADENLPQGLSAPDGEALQFQVSSGLKRVLGRELITDDEVAIFELVKNSFDAGATHVYLHFGEDSITVADDGEGMTKDDLQEKWLFVAYSSKRSAHAGSPTGDFRDQAADRQHFAGSKGIGRFSSDRLGRFLTLQTRTSSRKGEPVHRLDLDWSKFEENDLTEFDTVNVTYRQVEEFEVPPGVPVRPSGTIIDIRQLSKRWTREDLLRLRAGLAKLINPFGASVDGFDITIIAQREIDADNAAVERLNKKSPDLPVEAASVVNGLVRNFLFSTLQQKTTFIEVSIDPDSNTIETALTDRGELIYRIREPNRYQHLRDAGFRCELYYLNRAAKATFARRMGLPSVQFGSVFVFRNGFRVFPIGESNDDSFEIDRRKQQGYARYLGTRDVIGRIDVSGSESMFQEASSRNQGLISTPAVLELRECFRENCLKRLERYVVPVSWGVNDADNETLAFVETDNGRARVSASFADLIGGTKAEVIEYSTRLIDTLNERSDQFENSLSHLRIIADKTGDSNLFQRIEEAEQRFQELKQAEAEARRIADEERRAKEQAQATAAAATAEAAAANAELHEERKRNLFLASISSLDTDTILGMHHQVTIYAVNLQQQIENLLLKVGQRQEVPRDLVVNGLEPMTLLTRRILAVAKFATKANFRMESEYIEADLSDYIVSYIEGVAKFFLSGGITIDVTTDGHVFTRRFKPIDVSIVIDNLVSNSRKARATKIEFELQQPRKGFLEVRVRDDGRGLISSAIQDGRLFEKGFTTTDGSGLGLYHVRQVLGDMGGSIEVMESGAEGAAFLMRIPE